MSAEAERVFPPEELRADLDFLVDTIRAAHPRPEVVPLVGSGERRAALEQTLGEPIRRLEFCLRVAPLVNDSPDGHTFLRLPSEEFRAWEERGGRRFPWEIEFRPAKDGAVHAFVAAGVSTGDEVLAVNGVPTADLVARLLPYPNGETPIRRLLVLRYALGGLLHAVLGLDGPYELTVRAGEGAPPRTVAHPGVTATERPAQRDEAQTPYEYRSLDEGTGLIDFREFSDPERFEAFLDETFARIGRERVRALVVDLRGNDGGMSVLGDLLLGYVADRPLAQYERREVKVSRQIRELYAAQPERRRYDPDYDRIVAAPDGSLLTFPGPPATLQSPEKRFRGDLYVLIGPASYSSATMLASAVKDHHLGVLVGEETGGSATQYADMCPFTLPRTGLQGFVSHKWFLRPSGLDDGRGVLPDVEVAAEAALERAKRMIVTGRP